MNEREIIKEWITMFVSDYANTHEVETRWGEPIIGVADAHDPLYKALKRIISPTHALPSDIVPDAKSVIVYFVPFADSIVKSNIPGEESSREWDYAYIETNQMLEKLNTYLHNQISSMGYQASNLPPTYNYDKDKLISDWSHRSSAYIAGIGKFGIHNMLITEQGCCGRMSSVITNWNLQPSIRTEEEYCLYKSDGLCGKCVTRCVNHAFAIREGEVSFDRYKCNEQIYDKIIPQWSIGPGDTCGKCMCGVPCSFINPQHARKNLKRRGSCAANELFKDWNMALLHAYWDGFTGSMMLDDEKNPKAAVIDVGDFCFLAGVPSRELLGRLKGSKLLIPKDTGWEKLIEEIYGDSAKRFTRYAIKKEPDVFDLEKLQVYIRALDTQYELREFDREIYEMAQRESWSYDLCSQFKDYEEYKNRAVGMAILHQGKLVSGASPYAIYADGIEIEIDTNPRYRKKGLATVCGAALIVECLNRGLYPGWDAHDLRSVALAKKLGYHLDFPYSAYEVGGTALSN